MEENNNIIPTPTEVIKSNNLHKSWILVAGLVILTVVLLVVSLASKNSSRLPYVPKNSQENIAHTTLSVSEDVRATGISGKYETDVNIDSGSNEITGVQLQLSYDPMLLKNVDITTGQFIPNAVVLRKEIDSVKGTIFLTIGTPQGSQAVKGKGSLVVISFTKTGSDITSIDFLPETLVTDQRYDRSVLNETASGSIGTLPGTSTFQPTTSPASNQ